MWTPHKLIMGEYTWQWAAGPRLWRLLWANDLNWDGPWNKEIPNCILKGAPGAPRHPPLGMKENKIFTNNIRKGLMRIDDDSLNGAASALTSVNLFLCQLLLQLCSSPVSTVAWVDELVFHLQEHLPILGDGQSAFMEQNAVWQKLQLIFRASTSSFFYFFPRTSVKKLLPLPSRERASIILAWDFIT